MEGVLGRLETYIRSPQGPGRMGEHPGLTGLQQVISELLTPADESGEPWTDKLKAGLGTNRVTT